MFDYIVQMCGYVFRQIMWITAGRSKKKQRIQDHNFKRHLRVKLSSRSYW
jgi:hypothetical protein